MNRTYSHSWRSFKTSPNNTLMQRSAVGFGLRTLWKDRETHQLSAVSKNSKIGKKKVSQPASKGIPQMPSRQEVDKQEIKDFIKMMKKKSDEPVKIPKPVELPKEPVTCRSSRSIRSETKSLCDSKDIEPI